MYELLVKHYNKYNSVKFHFIELMEYEFPVTDVIAFNDYHRLIFRGSDSLYPGCMDKTIKGLEYERENIYNGKYDYIIRTNISSIINIKLLADNINSLSVKYDYMGSIENLYRYGNIVTNDELASKHYASGTMIVMSPHFAKLIMNNSKKVKFKYISRKELDKLMVGAYERPEKYVSKKNNTRKIKKNYL